MIVFYVDNMAYIYLQLKSKYEHTCHKTRANIELTKKEQVNREKGKTRSIVHCAAAETALALLVACATMAAAAWIDLLSIDRPNKRCELVEVLKREELEAYLGFDLKSCRSR